LWLYEGVTEYFAGNVQVKSGLISRESYLKILQQKLSIADRFKDDLPFTELSRDVLDKYENQYYNVYMKGALIGLCLDIKLRSLSGGKYGLQQLISDLSMKYGKDHSFKDDELFHEIGVMTFPEIETFMNTYVGGSESLPLASLLEKVGVRYEASREVRTLNLGFGNDNIGMAEYNGSPYLSFQNCDKLTEQGKLLGIQDGDMLVKINDVELGPLGPATSELLAKHKAGMKDGEKMAYTVLRKNDAGNYQEVRLEAEIKASVTKQKHFLSFDESASPEQLMLREGWLSGK